MINISLKEFVNVIDPTEYEVLEALQPSNTFAGNKADIQSLQYVEVKYCIKLLSKVDSWDVVVQLFTICFGLKNESEFWEQGVKEFYQAKKYIIRELSKIYETEAKIMESKSTDQQLWQMAGADKLKPFNDTMPLHQLGKLFGIYPYDLGKKPYKEVFSLIAQNKIYNDVESAYQKLMSNS